MENQSFIQFVRDRRGITLFLAIVFLFITLGFGITSQNRNNRDSDSRLPEEQQQSSKFSPLADKTLVYGYWGEDGSYIEATDLKTGLKYSLAILPLSIKHVTVMSPQELLFINETDASDLGKSVVTYDIENQAQKTILKADSGYGIELYLLSPNKRFMSVWQKSLSENSTMLGGRSRVYTINLGNGNKSLIYDEAAVESQPIHFPVGITDSGDTFFDSWIPNSSQDSGTGWAYGMTRSNADGSSKQDITVMTNGTYSNPPSMSPDGRYLSFAGYDSSRGSGTERVNGYRRAIVLPNTVEILDTSTNMRTKITEFENTFSYSPPVWNNSGGILLVSGASRDEDETGTYFYNVNSKTYGRVSSPDSSRSIPTTISVLSENNYLMGYKSISPASSGNLGPTYAQSLSEALVFQNNNSYRLAIEAPLVQFITVVGGEYYAGISVPRESLPQLGGDGTRKSLQLQTFSLKPKLVEEKEIEQNNPIIPPVQPQPESPGQQRQVTKPVGPACREVATYQCNQLIGTNYPVPASLNSKLPEDPAWQTCYFEKRQEGVNAGTCIDSPLYLYGKKGTKVTVEAGTQISNSNAPFTNNAYTAILDGNGNMHIGGQLYESIMFDYAPAVRVIRPPQTGIVVSKSELPKKLEWYAQKLGLNERETQDVMEFGNSVSAPYVMVSHFDHDTSHAMLPLSFNPQPDVYRSIVMYFKEFEYDPKISLEAPRFEPLIRRGLTAIEVSFIRE